MSGADQRRSCTIVGKSRATLFFLSLAGETCEMTKPAQGMSPPPTIWAKVVLQQPGKSGKNKKTHHECNGLGNSNVANGDSHRAVAYNKKDIAPKQHNPWSYEELGNEAEREASA